MCWPDSLDSGTHTLRTEIEKKPLQTIEGVVRTIRPMNLKDKSKGFYCNVDFDDELPILNTFVVVNSLERVKGTQQPGARIRIEHRGSNHSLNFSGYYSLYLESITFMIEKAESGS